MFCVIVQVLMSALTAQMYSYMQVTPTEVGINTDDTGDVDDPNAIRPYEVMMVSALSHLAVKLAQHAMVSKTIIQVRPSGVPPFWIVSALFSIVSAPFSIVSAPFSIENGAETKHLNSTRTARPPKGPGSSSRIQML